MKIHEYQAKDILGAYGISTPDGVVGDNASELFGASKNLGFPLVIKAQVLVGGRGKAGAIRMVSDAEELRKGLSDILAMTVKALKVKKVLVEKALDIKRQFYLGIIVDRSKQTNAIVVSADGGVDIEDTAKSSPEKISRVFLKDAHKIGEQDLLGLVSFLGLDSALAGQFTGMVNALFSAYVKTDAQLAEINPLVLTREGRLMACDAKVIIDDNALFRHPELSAFKEESDDNELEREAHKLNLAYVKLSGNIGVIGNGAGLVMATMDEVKRAGGKPANFLDIGGGAKKEVMENSLKILHMDKEVEGIIVNIFGGITRCDEVALGIIQSMKKAPKKIPMVMRLAGTQCEEGMRLLSENSDISTAGNMEEAAKKIVAMVGKG